MFSLKLFGGVSLEAPNGEPVTGRAVHRHRVGLLALLSAAGAAGMSRDKLIAYLWPELDEERGRHLLSNSIYVLRQKLGEDALLGGETLRLNAARLRCDVREFEEAFAGGHYEEAVQLHAGPFLDGFFLPESAEFDEWAERERSRLAGAHARGLEALAEAAEAAGDRSGAVDRWRERTARDPYDSRLALRLMQALDAAGNRAGAVQHAEAHGRLLREELGMAPEPAVTAFAERLRRDWGDGGPVPGGRAIEAPGSTDPPAEAPIAEAPIAAAPVAEVAALTRGPGSRRSSIFGAAAVLGAVVLAGAGLVAADRFSAAGDTEPEQSIVVLPFVSMTGDSAGEFFSDGLTEEIIARLSALPDVKTISRTSAMHYKGADKPLREIAGELDVAHVLEGSVRRSGDRVRITAQLIDARTDGHLWAETYDYELADVFRVQEEIATAVAEALSVQLGRRERALIARTGTTNPEALRLYHRARELWNTRSKVGHQQALEFLRQAIALDSGYADAYAAMADVYLTGYHTTVLGLSEQESFSRVKSAAERALALDDSSADAHASYAVVLWWQRDWPGAERELLRAIDLNPGHATAHAWYALLLGGLGRLEASVREARRAAELDPFASGNALGHASACLLARDHACTLEQLHRVLEIRKDWAAARATLGTAHALNGRDDLAMPELEFAVEAAPHIPWIRGALAYGHARGGRREEAERLVGELQVIGRQEFPIARVFAALGEPDSAFAYLDRTRWTWPHEAVLADPALDPLRADPRFAVLTERVAREMGVR